MSKQIAIMILTTAGSMFYTSVGSDAGLTGTVSKATTFTERSEAEAVAAKLGSTLRELCPTGALPDGSKIVSIAGFDASDAKACAMVTDPKSLAMLVVDAFFDAAGIKTPDDKATIMAVTSAAGEVENLGKLIGLSDDLVAALVAYSKDVDARAAADTTPVDTSGPDPRQVVADLVERLSAQEKLPPPTRH